MNKDIFNGYLSKLVDVSFMFNPDWGKWELRKPNRVERINISYREYPGSFYIDGLSASIIFSEVENVINEVLSKYKIQQNYGDKTIKESLHNIEGADYSKFKTEIHDEASFQVVAEEIKKIVEYGALPFFEKYKTLEGVANLLAPLKIEEIVPYIQGGILLPKTVLILRETNHPKYFERLKEFYAVLKEYAQAERYVPLLKLYEDLFSEDLKKI